MYGAAYYGLVFSLPVFYIYLRFSYFKMPALKSMLSKLRKDGYRHWREHVDAYMSKHKSKMSKSDKLELGEEVYHTVLKLAAANLDFDDEEREHLAEIIKHFSLPAELVSKTKRHYAPKALKMMAEFFLIDDILTSSEVAQLLAFGAELDLTEEEVTELVKGLTEKKKK